MIKKLLLIVLIAFFSIDTNGQINEFTKNMQLHEGLFNYYWDNKTGVNEDSNKIELNGTTEYKHIDLTSGKKYFYRICKRKRT